MKPRALIFGGYGFVGRHLARELKDRYEVISIGRADDIRNRTNVFDIVGRTAPEIVIHLAAITTVKETFERPREAYEVSFIGLLNLFEALKTHKFRGRMLYVSSSEVYGFPNIEDLPLTEAAKPRPMSPYSVAKLAAEFLCHQWNYSEETFDILVARAFTHIGPGQSDRFAVARFSQQIAEIKAGRRKSSLTIGNLTATRDLTDVRDVARAYDLILQKGERGEVYNVCSGCEVVMHDVFSQLIVIAGIEAKLIEDSSLVRKSEQERLLGSYAKLNAATGWAPQIPLPRTLSEIFESALIQAQSG